MSGGFPKKKNHWNLTYFVKILQTRTVMKNIPFVFILITDIFRIYEVEVVFPYWKLKGNLSRWNKNFNKVLDGKQIYIYKTYFFNFFVRKFEIFATKWISYSKLQLSAKKILSTNNLAKHLFKKLKLLVFVFSQKRW